VLSSNKQSMLFVDDYIQNLVNADDKSIAIELSKELSDLLWALEKDGLLREKLSGTILEKRHIIIEAQKNNDAILATFNKYYNLYFKLEQREKYLDFMRNNGFTDLDLMHLLHSQMIFIFLANMEIFKNFINLILKDSCESTLGYLFGKGGVLTNIIVEGKIVSQRPEGRAIASRLDIQLRNAFSHFTFTEEGKNICYYTHHKEKDNIVLEQRQIPSTDLYKKTIEVSLMKAILGCLIADWYDLDIGK
jgi:hypothetical protein